MAVSAGSGPGGQKVNRSKNCVRLVHVPTGISVRSHAHRSLEANVKAAKSLLARKVDLEVRGRDSPVFQRAERERERSGKAHAKKAKRHEALKEDILDRIRKGRASQRTDEEKRAGCSDDDEL